MYKRQLLAVEHLWRSRKPLQPALLLGGTCAAGVGNALLLGTLGNGYSSSRDGYGFYSMNLNAVFNPDSLGGYTWSHLLPKRAHLYGQYDGFNYLGLGVLALLAVMAVVSAVTAVKSPRCRAGLARTLHRNAFLLVMLALLKMCIRDRLVRAGRIRHRSGLHLLRGRRCKNGQRA